MLLEHESINISIDIQIVDDTGLPVLGLVAATFPNIFISKGIDDDISVVLVDLTDLTDAHTDGGIKERNGGYYRFDPPDSIASTISLRVTIRGEETGKRVIAPPIQVGDVPLDISSLSTQVSVDDIQSDLDTKLNAVLTDRTLPTADYGTLANQNTLLTRLSAARAGYIDNLNTIGIVASQADIIAINQSASRRIILTTIGQYERPEVGNVTYSIEARTYDGDGAPVNADVAPSLTATGIISGDLSVNLSAITNPATGVYRWTYTVSNVAIIEQIRFDISASLGFTVFTLSAYTQIVDFVAATFTTADRTKLDTLHDVRLTATRADNLDEITALRLSELDAINIPADIDEINTKTDNLDATISSRSVPGDAMILTVAYDAAKTAASSTIFDGITKLANWLRLLLRNNYVDVVALGEINVGGGTFIQTDHSLEAIDASIDSQSAPNVAEIAAEVNTVLSAQHGAGLWGGSSSGIGAFIVNINVKDNLGNPVEDAFVSLHRAGDFRHGKTDANGDILPFSSDAVTWQVAISAPGLKFTPEDLVITDNVSKEYIMQPNSPVVPPVGTNQVNGVAPVFDKNGNPEDGVSVTMKMILAPTNTGIYDDEEATFISAGGFVILEKMFQTATYAYWRGTNSKQKQRYKVPVTEEIEVDLPPVLGNDSVDPCDT